MKKERHELAERLVKAIDAGYDQQVAAPPRNYIGASTIGHPCDAHLAFRLRGFAENPVPARMKRVFDMGHTIENMVVTDIKQRAKWMVWEKDPATGKQWGYEFYGGHVKCHMDGHIDCGDGKLCGLEIKSMNAHSFERFREHGVRVSHPRYYAQMQTMMGISGFREFVLIAYCKDDSSYEAELVAFDEVEWSYLQARLRIVTNNDAVKIGHDEADWRCRQCQLSEACWRGAQQEVACRSCQHARAREDGAWFCDLHARVCTEPCDQYRLYHPRSRKK